MITCLYDVVGYALLGSMGLCVYFHAICLDLCFHMPMCLDMCSLHALCHHLGACMLHTLFMHLGLDLVCHVMCYSSPFVSFVVFSCVLA